MSTRELWSLSFACPAMPTLQTHKHLLSFHLLAVFSPLSKRFKGEEAEAELEKDFSLMK